MTPKTKEVKVWLGEEDVGLESLRRDNDGELEEVLGEDWKKQEKLAAERNRSGWLNLPPNTGVHTEVPLENHRDREYYHGAGNAEEIARSDMSRRTRRLCVKRWVGTTA